MDRNVSYLCLHITLFTHHHTLHITHHTLYITTHHTLHVTTHHTLQFKHHTSNYTSPPPSSLLPLFFLFLIKTNVCPDIATTLLLSNFINNLTTDLIRIIYQFKVLEVLVKLQRNSISILIQIWIADSSQKCCNKN